MQFTTFDIEFADVLLPSICSISIIDWNETGITNVYRTMINPDCDIEPFLQDRHHITAEQTIHAPTISEVWIDIYNHLENKIVFSHYANRNVRSLKNLADINYLNMPPFIFCCSASIARKMWPYFESDKLPEVTERLGVNENHYDSYEDAKSVGYIVQKALSDTESNNIYEFFSQIGFSGGYVKDGERHIYRAIKRNETYHAKVSDEDIIKELEIDKAESFQGNNEDIVSFALSEERSF